MEECYVKAFGTLAGSFVYQAATFSFGFGKRVGHTVFHCECDMLYAAAAAVVGDKFRDSAVFAGAFEQFYLVCPTLKNAVRTF